MKQTLTGLAMLILAAPAGAQTIVPVQPVIPVAVQPCGDYKSTEQLEDGRVTFRLCAPRATEVLVGGDSGLGARQMPMTRDEQGLWTVTTAAPVGPDTYRYTFRVDGVNVAGSIPASPTSLFNGLHRQENTA